jgi:hypothetical protein
MCVFLMPNQKTDSRTKRITQSPACVACMFLKIGYFPRLVESCSNRMTKNLPDKLFEEQEKGVIESQFNSIEQFHQI